MPDSALRLLSYTYKAPFTHTLRVAALCLAARCVAAREAVTKCISMVAFTHTLRGTLLRSGRKMHKKRLYRRTPATPNAAYMCVNGP